MLMARLIQQRMSDSHELLFLFANTGQEHPKTLEFIERSSQEWGLPIVWIEAVQHPGERKSATHREVSFSTADREGLVFEAMIAKYGIPNRNYPHCTRELKLHPMLSYVRSIGWQDVDAAVGIRIDEPRRLKPKPRVVYPLADWWPHDKLDVLDFWGKQTFDLGLEDREGNCVWCWKKSAKKHFLNIQANPEWYEFPSRMEAVHSLTRRDNPQVFFRGGVSTRELISMSKGIQVDPRSLPREYEDSGCSESCEAFGSVEEGETWWAADLI